MDSYAVYPSLKGKVVFVTGGATGIGESIVTHFCRQGSKVAFVDINAQAGEKLRSRLAEEAGNAPEFLQCSVTDIDALQAAIRDVRAASWAPSACWSTTPPTTIVTASNR